MEINVKKIVMFEGGVETLAKTAYPKRHVKLSTICVSISNVNTTKRILSGNVIAVKMPSAHRSV